MKPCLSIAGSDCSGGAGIQADLKTFAAHGVYGMSVITALTAQNTLGVKSIETVNPEFVKDQLTAIFADIKPAAIKLGMLSNAEIIHAVTESLSQHTDIPIVLDPVMVATSGTALLDNDALSNMIEMLFPLTTLVTPNIAEFTSLCRTMQIKTPATLSTENVADLSAVLVKALPQTKSNKGVTLLVKGGHLSGKQSSDYFFSDELQTWLSSPRLHNSNTHGSGCTLSAAITANLTKGLNLVEATQEAKNYLTRVIGRKLNLGRGNGPLQHSPYA